MHNCRYSTNEEPDPRAVVADVLLLLTTTLDSAAKLVAMEPAELVFSTPDGIVGVAAGPAQRLLPAAHAGDLLCGVTVGAEAEIAFLALLSDGGAAQMLYYAAGPWLEAVSAWADHTRAMLPVPDAAWYAPTSTMSVH